MYLARPMNKFGDGFKKFTRIQIGLFWFLIGFSLGGIFMMLMIG